ncbi:DMT family transporter [Actinokineospora sp. 24-640]
MSDLIIAIALCVAVAIVYATAALIQADRAHLSIKELTRVPVWWLALALNGLGAAMHVVSLGFGPLSLIQPLGVLTLVIAVPVAAATARRRVTRLEAVGMAATVVGLAGLSLIITTGGDPDTLTSGELTGLLVAGTVVIGVLGFKGQQPGASTLWEAVAGGMAFAVCSALCQTVVVHLEADGPGVLLRPATLVSIVAIATLAIAATVFTQRSYRDGLAAPLAVTNLVNPATATAIGVVFLGESLATTRLDAVLATACAILAAYGVTQLARARDAETTYSRLP